ncbi:uncharacterized protein MYCFIDRAFT_171008 [Pseudocercospora fijiensis CIRAD86]|uniref:Uncharacterized protein n=1 Tax=Pseudocercospora fijiensis (strain CIRAD86) TaxID=383855 RepID=N1QD12_PSEFD|nr:uncharacterized protein MYCFIDRAFT_171008 [Pseudocercospora fijiensis CIRAD86]EME89578.1 hypothetical protein MYCFIDRAFT_171008 [Pseudocercospora fijiensis CIRAD86]
MRRDDVDKAVRMRDVGMKSEQRRGRRARWKNLYLVYYDRTVDNRVRSGFLDNRLHLRILLRERSACSLKSHDNDALEQNDVPVQSEILEARSGLAYERCPRKHDFRAYVPHNTDRPLGLISYVLARNNDPACVMARSCLSIMTGNHADLDKPEWRYGKIFNAALEEYSFRYRRASGSHGGYCVWHRTP